MKLALAAQLCVTILLSSFLFGQQNAPAQLAASASPQARGKKDGPPMKHKIGPLGISVNWRTRAEGWNWFEAPTGNSDYGFWNSLLRVGIGQTGEKVEWFLEGEQPLILGLPGDAVIGAPQGQLGLGGSYYAANHNHTNVANGFVKQAFVNFKQLGPAALKIGRFEYFDGLEVKPKDSLLATVIQTRISSRLISNFAFTAVQRSFDGVKFSANAGSNNFTFFGGRPTQGVFQVKGMDELDVDTYYGAYTHSVSAGESSGQFRLFAIGYIDHRTRILKTDNRPAPIRAADFGKIEIATWGADYVHVINTAGAGKFDVLAWGAIQTGSWGSQSQHAGSFVGEAGWQPPVKILKPWASVGYSWGSGDNNPNDSRHGTFFQDLPTPRQYARFPFYNMMNNEDWYGTLNLKPVSKLALRSEAHALRLASASDLWYSGGGAFQPSTFGYTGRPSNGNRGLANVWDASADYQFTPMFGTTLYYGHAWGKGVISPIYPKDKNGQLVFLETNLHF
ncbi:MAG TPA: alginate export family protein [Candidatus Sulfotelmatobacter sp.]|nr:alginate export family protein [Candidatus Sulfotelmatobacter sp.]